MERSAFDALFTTDRLQILKVLLPCLPPGRQGGLAVYIKMQELFHTMDIVRNHPGRLREALGPVPNGDTILEQILPFCSSSQKEQIRQFQQMNRQMDSMREMMETVQMMQSLFPEGMNPEEMDLSQIMTMFSAAGMGGAEDGAASGQSPGQTDPPAQTPGGSDPVKVPYAAQENGDRAPFVTPDTDREVIQEQMPVTDFPSFIPRDDDARDSEGIPFPAWRTDIQAEAKDML